MREADWKDRMLLRLGRRRAVRVAGDSMRPTLNDGDVILVAKSANFTVGDIVLADHPFKQNVTIVKRIAAIDDGRYHLRGDNRSESSDGRSFGTVHRRLITGKAICRLT